MGGPAKACSRVRGQEDARRSCLGPCRAWLAHDRGCNPPHHSDYRPSHQRIGTGRHRRHPGRFPRPGYLSAVVMWAYLEKMTLCVGQKASRLSAEELIPTHGASYSSDSTHIMPPIWRITYLPESDGDRTTTTRKPIWS